jgi:uncharacterized protein (TIGR02246 family)
MKHLIPNTFLAAALTLGVHNSAVADINKLKSIAESANATWNQALNSGNASALAALYAENAILSPGNGKTLSGRTEIAALFKSFVDSGVHNHTLEIIEVGGNENLIYQVAKWNANGANKDGKSPSFGGITTSVLELGKDGKWLARTHVWNARD